MLERMDNLQQLRKLHSGRWVFCLWVCSKVSVLHFRHVICMRMCRCQRRLWELGFPVLPVCQLHWSNFAQPDPNAEQEGTEQEGAEQEGAEALSGGSEREGTSEHEGISEQEGSSAQEGVVEQQGSSRQQKGFFDQEGASDQEGVSEQQGASEQQDASEQQESPPHWRALLGDWMEAHDLTMDSDCFVIKPADESQGAGVLLVNDFESLELHAWHIFQQVSSLYHSQEQNKVVGSHCLALRVLLRKPQRSTFW